MHMHHINFFVANDRSHSQRLAIREFAVLGARLKRINSPQRTKTRLHLFVRSRLAHKHEPCLMCLSQCGAEVVYILLSTAPERGCYVVQYNHIKCGDARIVANSVLFVGSILLRSSLLRVHKRKPTTQRNLRLPIVCGNYSMPCPYLPSGQTTSG